MRKKAKRKEKVKGFFTSSALGLMRRVNQFKLMKIIKTKEPKKAEAKKEVKTDVKDVKYVVMKDNLEVKTFNSKEEAEAEAKVLGCRVEVFEHGFYGFSFLEYFGISRGFLCGLNKYLDIRLI